MIPRNPLAPPPLSEALWQISSIAEFVNRISTPEYPNNDWYCDMREPLTSVRIRRRSTIVNGASVVIEGRRDMNSGIKLRKVSPGKVELRVIINYVPVFNKIWMTTKSMASVIVETDNSPVVSTRSNTLWEVFLFGVKNGIESPCSGVGRVAVKPMDFQEDQQPQINKKSITYAFGDALLDDRVKANKGAT